MMTVIYRYIHMKHMQGRRFNLHLSDIKNENTFKDFFFF